MIPWAIKGPWPLWGPMGPNRNKQDKVPSTSPSITKVGVLAKLLNHPSGGVLQASKPGSGANISVQGPDPGLRPGALEHTAGRTIEQQ